jgi:hypothetical protein
MSEKVRDRALFWRAFKNVAIVFSFVVNFVLLVLLLILLVPGVRTLLVLRNDLLEPLVTDLDNAFVGLGEADIKTSVPISTPTPINFDLPLDKRLPVEFDLSIDQDTIVILNEPVPLSAPARFILPDAGGAINGQVSLSLPKGMALPVRLSLVVPVSKTIPVQFDVPVSTSVPIQMEVPVELTLGESGLNPVVGELRQALVPARQMVEHLPRKLLWLP